MANISTTIEKTKTDAAKATDKVSKAASPWIEGLARFGYAVRGLLYITVGALAVRVALGGGGQATDKNGAIGALGSQSFGKFLLVAIVIGLVGYSLWGFVRAIFDPLNRGKEPKGVAQRIGYVISGLSYGALVVPTISFIMGTGGTGSSSEASRDISAQILAQPFFGSWLLGLVGLIGIGGGLGQIWQAFTADFKKDLKYRDMSADGQKSAILVGRFGMSARGVVFALIGFFFLKAALNKNADHAKGLDGALQTLLQQPYGTWLLGVVALGLASFGVYSLLCARWIRVKRSE